MEVVKNAEAVDCARRCLAARPGQDKETQLSLTRAAGMFALKALGLVGEEPAKAPPRSLGQPQA